MPPFKSRTCQDVDQDTLENLRVRFPVGLRCVLHGLSKTKSVQNIFHLLLGGAIPEASLEEEDSSLLLILTESDSCDSQSDMQIQDLFR